MNEHINKNTPTLAKKKKIKQKIDYSSPQKKEKGKKKRFITRHKSFLKKNKGKKKKKRKENSTKFRIQ